MDVTKGEEDMDISNVEDPPADDGPMYPETLDKRNKRLAQGMKEAFSALEGLETTVTCLMNILKETMSLLMCHCC